MSSPDQGAIHSALESAAQITACPALSGFNRTMPSNAAPTERLKEARWAHGLGQSVTALIAAGLRIESLTEYLWCDWKLDFLHEREDGRFGLPPRVKGELPVFFSLMVTKPRTEG